MPWPFRSSWLLADYPPPMFVGHEITLALITTATAVACVIGLILWNRWSMKRTIRCRSCGHPFHPSHPDRCIDCGRTWRSKPLFPRWVMVPVLLLMITAGLAYPARQAYRWSAERGWSPPLPKYAYTLVHRYPSGHTVVRKWARNQMLEPGNVLLLRSPGGQDEVVVGWGSWVDRGPGLDLSIPPDITGDGLLEVVVLGGEGYMHTRTIFSLQPNGSFVKILDDEHYFQSSLGDLDRDGAYELFSSDSRFSYSFAPRIAFSVPSMIFSYDGTTWTCSPELMKRPPPDARELEALEKRLRGNDWSRWPDPDETVYPLLNEGSRELWSTMLDLTYAGNGRIALDLHESVWPEAAGNKDEALTYFLTTLRRYSSIWDDLPGMQEPPVAEFESLPDPELE